MPRSVAACVAALCSALGCLVLAGAPADAAGGHSGPWVWPLEGALRVVRAFDPPPQRWLAGHRGVDLLATTGAPVRSAGAGRVSFAGVVAGRGVVVVTHADGTRTTYEPVLAEVARADQVRAGDRLGVLAGGAGHCLPAACLHWGRRRGDVYLDPTLLLRAGPARLLPVWAARTGAEHHHAPPPPPRSAEPAGQPAAWGRLVATGAATSPVLVAGAALMLRRRRAQMRAGSSAASRA